MESSTRLFTCWLVLLTLACTGCSSLQPSNWKSPSLAWWNQEPEEPEPQIPNRLVSTWIDTVKHTPGERSERGFGGRIMFFAKEDAKPVHVQGQLVVYAYDESEGDMKSIEPTRRYIFPANQFAKHQSESTLGPSYSVWLPWDKVGGSMKNISLITRFEPVGGPLIVGEPTSHLLPGEQLVEKEPGKKSALPNIRLTQHAEELPSRPLGGSPRPLRDAARKELTTIDIPVPQNWNER